METEQIFTHDKIHVIVFSDLNKMIHFYADARA